jgi:hypothetical protein
MDLVKHETSASSAVFFFCSVATSMLALHNRHFLPRLLFLVLTNLCAWKSYTAIPSLTHNGEFVHMLSMLILLYQTHIVYCVLVLKHCTQSETPRPLSQDLLAAYKMVFNGRHIGHPLEVTPVPRRIAKDGKQLPHLPTSRFSFFISRALHLATIVILHTTLRTIYYHGLPTHGIEPLFSPFALLTYQAWHAWALYTGAHDALAIVHVSFLRIDSPTDWPPLFGSIAEAYTVRRLWGKFWHGIVRRTFSGYAGLVWRYLLPFMPRGGAAEKIWTLGFVFVLSGAVHALASLNVGFRACGAWADVGWFGVSAGAILVEELVAWMARGLVGGGGKRREVSMGLRWLGYAWVFGLMFWSVPRLYATKFMCAPLEMFL